MPTESVKNILAMWPTIIQIITFFAGIALALIGYLSPTESVMFTILFLMIEKIYILSLKQVNHDTFDGLKLEFYRLKREIEGKSIPLKHVEIPQDNWILENEYKRSLRKFSRRLLDIARGDFRIEIKKVPDISLDIINSIKICGFATVVIGLTDDLFYDPRGKKYLETCYLAAKRINGKFTRLFIYDSFLDITPNVYGVMEEHHNNCIRTLAVSKNQLKHHNIDPNSDFGLWDNKVLMQVTRDSGSNERVLNTTLNVHPSNIIRINEAKDTMSEMIKYADSWVEFNKKLCKPVNEKEWSTLTQRVCDYPPPAIPSDKDVDKMLKLPELTCEESKRVLVLGYTKKIVDKLISIKMSKQLDYDICVLDAGAYQPRSEYGDQVNLIQGNWLNWKPTDGMKYDVIFGDDVLLNLSIWQYSLFFKNISALIADRGALVLRTSAMFEDYYTFQDIETVHAQLVDIYDRLEDKNDIQKHIFTLVWPLFHSETFYNPDTKDFSISDWDFWLDKHHPLYKNNGRFKFHLNLRMTSPAFKDIIDYSKTWFEHSKTVDVDNYVEYDNDVNKFYKILHFVKKTKY